MLLVYYATGFVSLQVDELMRLSIFEQTVKDANLMIISFNDIFCE